MHGNLAEKKWRERKNKIIHHSRRRCWPSHSRCGLSGSLNIRTHYICVYGIPVYNNRLGGKRFRISANYRDSIIIIIYAHTVLYKCLTVLILQVFSRGNKPTKILCSALFITRTDFTMIYALLTAATFVSIFIRNIVFFFFFYFWK